SQPRNEANLNKQHYDAVVIGTGQGGKPLAISLADSGRKTAVIERGPVGGSCVNYGCTPTKTMVASARVAYLARRAADFGIAVGSVSPDILQIRRRKDRVVEDFRKGSEKAIDETEGLELIRGEASFTGPKEIEIEGHSRRLTAETVVINTGARPSIPPIEGLDSVPYLDSTSIMELSRLPDHLLIIGGGYIGLEFGQMFRRFGSQVTIVQSGRQLLTREDPEVADEVRKILEEDGIRVYLSSKAVRAERNTSGEIKLTIENSKGIEPAFGSHLLIATGRQPNSDRVGLELAGVETEDQGYIVVNDQLETSAEGIYAIGDVKGGPAFTHISYDDFRVLRSNLVEAGDASIKDRLVAYTVFIDPQLGRVGLTEAEARMEGKRIKVATMPMGRVARAIEMGETRGFMQAIVDADTGLILGATVLGVEGGELMSVIQVAMMATLPFTTLPDGIFVHPTLAESLNNLFEGL